MNTYLIGDTIRLKATIKNLDGDEEAPATKVVSVFRADGTTELLTDGAPSLTAGTTAQYYYDFTIPTSLVATEDLIALWEWAGPHSKKIVFRVVLMT